jgi:arylsulfatase A-like enzyme
MVNTVALRLPALPASARRRAVALIGADHARLRISLRRGDGEDVVVQRQLDRADEWQDFDVELTKPGEVLGQLTIDVAGVADGVVVIGAPVIYKPVAHPRRVLLYLIDTLAAKHMSLYGYNHSTTPHLSALAARGAWFANAFANASRTVESVPSMMLSVPAISNGVRDSFDKVGDDAILMAEDFQRAGYATACFSTNVNAGPRQGLDRGFDSFFDHIAFQWTPGESRTVPIEAVVAWMESQRHRPIFLYVHTAEPHYPYEAPEPFRNRFGQNVPPQAKPLSRLAERGSQRERVRYDEEIAFADERFHTFWQRLEQAGLTNGLITMVTADHGEEFREHGGARHGRNLHGETVRVPIIVQGPLDVVPARGGIDVAAQLLHVPNVARPSG